jgi:hypothetical protein
VSFLISLCAGNSSPLARSAEDEASNLHRAPELVVTMIKARRVSAGNRRRSYSAPNDSYCKASGSSETLRENEIYEIEYSTTTGNKEPNLSQQLKEISVHLPKHRKPTTEEEFGHYLAGLIEGDGSFSVDGSISICFHELDAPLAYYIKKQIGYGSVYKIPNKNAVLYRVAHSKGVLKIANLINGKLRTDKVEKLNQNTLPRVNKGLSTPLQPHSKVTHTKINENYWLVGFSDADASFQVKIVKSSGHKTGYEVRLNFKVDQKRNDILILLKEEFGGYVGHRKSQDTYYYGSVSFQAASKVIKYFDRYQLNSSKYVNYIKWRKVYCMIMNQKHLTEAGLERIKKIKNSMNSLSSEQFELELSINPPSQKRNEYSQGSVFNGGLKLQPRSR